MENASIRIDEHRDHRLEPNQSSDLIYVTSKVILRLVGSIHARVAVVQSDNRALSEHAKCQLGPTAKPSGVLGVDAAYANKEIANQDLPIDDHWRSKPCTPHAHQIAGVVVH